MGLGSAHVCLQTGRQAGAPCESRLRSALLRRRLTSLPPTPAHLQLYVKDPLNPNTPYIKPVGNIPRGAPPTPACLRQPAWHALRVAAAYPPPSLTPTHPAPLAARHTQRPFHISPFDSQILWWFPFLFE